MQSSASRGKCVGRPAMGQPARLPPSRALLTAGSSPLTLGDLALPFLQHVQQQTELGWKDGVAMSKEYSVTSTCLGSGAFGKVRLAVHRSSGTELAVKTMAKVRARQTRERTLEKIRRETTFLERLQHCEQVAQLVDRFETDQEVHLVLSLCRGGDLRQVVETCGPLDEQSLASVARQAVQFIGSCHEQGLLYGDLKPANFCLMQPHTCGSSRPMQLKAIDFGTSQNCGPHHRLSKWTGTLTFLSPEVYAQNYGHKADMWSLGVALYWCFCRRYPFWAGDGQPPLRARLEDMAEVVCNAPIAYDYGPWLHASPEAVDFIQRCLTREESKRMSVADAMQHPWFARLEESSVLLGVGAGVTDP